MRVGWTVFLIVVLLGAGGGAYYWYLERGRAAPPPAAGPPGGFAMPVEASPVTVDVVVKSISAIGTLRSNESVVIAPEIAGRVVEIPATEGKAVAAGAVVVMLDDSIYRAELARAQALLALSQANDKRAHDLMSKGAGTVRAADEADSALHNDEAAIALARARLDKMRIVAPFDGILGMRRVSVGAYLDPGDPVINLEQIDPLKVDFRIPEVLLDSVRSGQAIEIETAAFAGRKFAGEVYAIDPLVDESGRSVVVRARVPNTDGPLRPGLFVRVSLIFGRHENAILVPERALVPFGDDLFVYRVVDGKAAMAKVVVGERRRGEAEIVQGLAPGDVVVTDGQMKIMDGMPVSVLPPADGAAS